MNVTGLVEGVSNGQAYFWSYSLSHEELHIRIEHPGVKGNIHLVCNGCLRICAPTAWKVTELHVRPIDTGKHPQFLLTDKAAGVEILCELVRYLKDVAPLFTPPIRPERPR